MHNVIFIGDHRQAAEFRAAGIPSYAPALGHLAERVIAERGRCHVLAISESAFRALPETLAQALRESRCPRLALVPDGAGRAWQLRLPTELGPDGPEARYA